MDNNMSTTAFIHRSSGSGDGSSSISSTGSSGGTSSIGQGNSATAGSGGGARMAVIGVTRNIRLRRRGASGFGFSLRGGREYAAGFYVSDVQPGGEAYRNGLRVGDQIIRINGYPVEDAVHQEVALLAKNQQVLVLKIKSVGMIPVKDNPNDPVTWHMVQQQQQQQQQQTFSYNDSPEIIPYNEIRIRVMVGERGRLGCGVCKGTVPGLTVQGTREGGAARLAGLKAGDIIIWCNGQRLGDLPFERAIEIMRSAAILNLTVNRPIPQNNGHYDCPETLWMRGSSGYDSESSSLPQSPLPPLPPLPPHYHTNYSTRDYLQDDFCSKKDGRLKTVDCFKPLQWENHHTNNNNHRLESGMNVITTDRLITHHGPNNKTIIQVNHHMNQYRSDIIDSNNVNMNDKHSRHHNSEPLYDPVATCYQSHDFDDANPVEDEKINKRTIKDNVIRFYGSPAAAINEDNYISRNNVEISEQTTVKVYHANCGSPPLSSSSSLSSPSSLSCPPPPPPPPPPPLSLSSSPQSMSTIKCQLESKATMNRKMGSMISMGSTGSTETESSVESVSSGGNKESSSLSSSVITSTSLYGSKSSELILTANNHSTTRPIITTTATVDLGSAIARELERRVQQKNILQHQPNLQIIKEKFLTKKVSDNKDKVVAAHDKLIEEFKQVHRKMFNQQKCECSEVKPNESQLSLMLIKNSHLNTQDKRQTNEKKEEVEEEAVGTSEVAGKIAVKIGAYEGEIKQPTRFDFLTCNRKNDEIDNNDGSVTLKLQNELLATLERSNLKNKTGEAVGTSNERSLSSSDSVLMNRIMIKVNPERTEA